MSTKRNEGYTKDMSRDEYSYRGRSAAEVKKKRARRKKIEMYKRLTLLGFIVALAIVGVITVISVISGGSSDDTEKSTGKLQANATENSNFVSGSQNSEGSEEQTTEEDTTEELTTEDYYRYGDETYNDGELVVCIDAGHGGNDTGCVGIDGSYEKDDVLMLAKLVVKALEEKGVKVVTTRTTDEWVDLYDRPVFANMQHADIFVSIHRNSLENDTVTKGFEAWICNEDSENSEELANMIMDNLEQVGISKNRGVKKGTQGSYDENYRVNSASAMPSVLLEMGFMSSSKDNQLYKDNAKAYAEAFADAIIQWSSDKPY